MQQVLGTIGALGVADVVIGRSPFGKPVQEYVGYERMAYWLYDNPQVIHRFFEFQWPSDLSLVQMAAELPARIAIISDHADEHLIPPPWFRDFCVLFYSEACRILHAAGKLVSTHLDGNFRGHFPYLAATGFDLLDGCTPAPMNNYTAAELAAAMPANMAAYVGVPCGLFMLEDADDEILESAREIVAAFRTRGRLILNVGDVLPANARIQPLVKLGRLAQAAGR